jgi:hypothetical protein
MHIEGRRADLGLTEHHMHLASMMGLVIKEMKDGWGSFIHTFFTSAICVSQLPCKKIVIDLFEERFDACVLLYPRGVNLGKGFEQDSIQRWCRFTAPGKSRHPDSIAQQNVVQQRVNAAEGAAAFASILGKIQLPNLHVESLIGDPVVTGKDSKSVQHILHFFPGQSIEA